MQREDAAQRRVLGWPIQWIAGLFSLLMVVAGTLPTLAGSEADASFGEVERSVFATPDDERVCSVELTPATTDLLNAKTFAEGEAEGEKTAEKANTPPALQNAHLLALDAGASRAAQQGDRAPRRIDPSGPLAPRAPPIA